MWRCHTLHLQYLLCIGEQGQTMSCYNINTKNIKGAFTVNDKETPSDLKEKVHYDSHAVEKRLEELREKVASLTAELSHRREYMQRLILEINEAKNYIASLEDKVEEQKEELGRRQDIIDEAATVIRSLLDADSGADLHDITEHVSRLFGTESKPSSV